MSDDTLDIDGVEVGAGDTVTVEYENPNVGAILDREEEVVEKVNVGSFAMPDYIQFGDHDAINRCDIVSVEKHD